MDFEVTTARLSAAIARYAAEAAREVTLHRAAGPGTSAFRVVTLESAAYQFWSLVATQRSFITGKLHIRQPPPSADYVKAHLRVILHHF